jgi:hypothetical protein
MFPYNGIALTSNGLYESGLPAAVRAENGDMFFRTNSKAKIVEHDLISPHHADVVQV